MSVSLSSHRRSDIVARLRSAGCVFAEDEARLLISEARTPAELTAMVDRRAAGLPLEHVIGWAEFCGLRIAVDPGVFVPRRRTEFLVSEAVSLARPPAQARPPALTSPPALARPPALAGAGTAAARPVVVDLCCGSGAVGAALAAALGQIDLHAADVDPAAVACARRNVTAAGGRVYEGDLYEPLPAAVRGHVDLLAANVPYVPTGEVGLLPLEARTHEPRVALDGGADGLDVLRRVIAGARLWLAPGGHLLSEISDRQAAVAVEAVAGGGLIPRVTSSEELDATVIIGTRPARPPRPDPWSSQRQAGAGSA
jgi:release factor glutamine methyltransferase